MSRFPRDIERDEPALFERWRGASRCPPPELLLPAIEGTLAPEPRALAVRTHLRRCGLCRELAESLGSSEIGEPSADELARIDARVLGETATGSGGRWAYAAAAAMLLAAGTGFVAWTAGSVTSPAVSAPAAASRSATKPAPEFVLALRKPEIELPPESLTLRSASPDRYAAALEGALDPFVREDYREAVRRLQQVARDYPQRAHPAYYLGVAQVMTGAPSEAVPNLERARERSSRGSSLYADSTWYLAVSLERSGRRASVAPALLELCGAGGSRDAEACDGIRALLTR
jgi:hypothetical protein